MKSIMTSILGMFKGQTNANLETPILKGQTAVVLDVGPEDMVVISCPGRLSIQQKKRIVDLWAEWSKDKTRPIVIDDRIKISVIRRANP